MYVTTYFILNTIIIHNIGNFNSLPAYILISTDIAMYTQLYMYICLMQLSLSSLNLQADKIFLNPIIAYFEFCTRNISTYVLLCSLDIS